MSAGDPQASAAAAIGAALDNPAPAPRLAEAGDPGPEMERGHSERPPFPPGSPVRPLGIRSSMDGEITCYYLDALGQLVGLGANNKHGKNSLIALYGEQSWWLEARFPQRSKPKKEYDKAAKEWVEVPGSSVIVGFDQAEASRALIEECCRKGIFDPAGRMRGRGAHLLEGGRLAMHYGDKVLAPRWRANGTAGEWEWHEPGLIEGNVYPAGEPMPRPAATSVGPRAAIRLTEILGTWNWRRGVLDVRLLLGAVTGAPFGGASPWRSAVWIFGPAGAGKSSLTGEVGILRKLPGRGLFSTADASAAGIRQSLKNSTVPVMFDEIEAEADNRRVQEVVKLARLAASGDKATRGGQDHNAHEFTIRSSFFFSSINIPMLEPQDRSRLAMLELRPFQEGQRAPDLSGDNFAAMGAELQRRVIDQWPRLLPTKERFHQALALAGHTSRACDQFGMLLAWADLAMNDELPDDEEISFWVDMCRPDRLAEVSEAVADEVACLYRLLTTPVQGRGNEEREPLANWIGKAVSFASAPLLADQREQDRAYAERLQQFGFKLVNAVRLPARMDPSGTLELKPARWGATEQLDPAVPLYLAISGRHQAIDQMLRETKWCGIHKGVLERLEGSIRGIKIKVGKMPMNCVLVPLYQVLDESELPDASKAEAVARWRADVCEGVEG